MIPSPTVRALLRQLGDSGLVPARPRFEKLIADNAARGGTRLDGFLAHPSAFWFVNMSDAALDGAAACGAVLGALVCARLHSSAAMLLL